MDLSSKPKTTQRSKKRLGRGYGSGKGGHTSSRGAKGRKAHGKVPLQFEGAAAGASFYKKLPLLRGKGKLKPNTHKLVGVNIKYLNILPKNSKITVETLIKHNIVSPKMNGIGIKILGDGELSVPLILMLPATKSAQEKIVKAGGTVGERSAKKEAAQETSPATKPVKKSK